MAKHSEFWQGNVASPFLFAAPVGWTHRLSTTRPWSVDSALRASRVNTATNRQIVSKDDLDSADADIILLVRQNNASAEPHGGPVVRGAGSTTSNNSGYHACWVTASNVLRLYRYVTGTRTTIASSSTKTLNPLLPHYIRLSVAGTALKAKIWQADQPQPEEWDIEATDSNVTDAGWVGLYTEVAATYIVDAVSIGTGADSADPLQNVMKGFVTDDDAQPLARRVLAIERASLAVVDSAMSSGIDGSVELRVPRTGQHAVVMLDEDAGSHNGMIFDHVLPQGAS